MHPSSGALAASIRTACSIYVAIFIVIALCAGCAQRPMKVPGETDIKIESVTLKGAQDQPLSIDYAPLIERLGMRAATLIAPDRYFSDFRVAEDRRRLIAYWQTHGYFDVTVEEPKLSFDDAAGTVLVVWTIKEGPRYKIGTVTLKQALPEHEALLKGMIPFGPGEEDVNLETFRAVRHTMGEELRNRGYGHANIYSRSFVDADNKLIHWFYYVDAGPKTRIATIVVDGNVKVPDEEILERIGLKPGDPFDLISKEKAEFDLLDTGAFASAFIRSDVDVKFIVPGTTPDTGGELRDEQIDENGDLVPRDLPAEVNLIVHVTEAPSEQFSVRGGVELDPNRIDTSLGSSLWFRNLFAPQHHLVLEGRIGYGAIYRGSSDDPSDFYGEALIRTLHPGTFGRLGDLRLTARFRDELFPGFHLRELTAGPGIRTAILKNLYFDLDVYARFGDAIDFGPFEAPTRAALTLPAEDESYGAELSTSLIWDARDNPVEPMNGHLLGLTAVFAPGEVINTHRYLVLTPDLRGFIPLGDSFSIGLRGLGGFVLLDGEDGVPLGPRQFGGGAFGFRGFGRHRLSPSVVQCIDPASRVTCRERPVGGLSLVEGSVEGRFLPYLKPYGAVVFADVGGAGADLNPFESGINVAAGLGLRLRLWYLPAAFDFAYRLLRDSEVEEPDSLDPILVFFRVGESF